MRTTGIDGNPGQAHRVAVGFVIVTGEIAIDWYIGGRVAKIISAKRQVIGRTVAVSKYLDLQFSNRTGRHRQDIITDV